MIASCHLSEMTTPGCQNLDLIRVPNEVTLGINTPIIRSTISERVDRIPSSPGLTSSYMLQRGNSTRTRDQMYINTFIACSLIFKIIRIR